MIHKVVIGLTAIGLCGNATVTAEDWPNWRGPRHDGISRESGLKVDWDQAIPMVWDRELGSGFSSFAARDGRLYTAGTQDDSQVVYCLDARSGEVVWVSRLGDKYHEPMGGSGPRATPSVHDGKVYVLGALGRLVCYDADDGKEIWSRKYPNVPQWGYSGSVLIEGDLAIISAGRDAGALVALNKETGDEAWRCGEDRVGYATPYPFDFNGKRYVCGFTGEGAIIAEVKTGKLVWRMPWQTSYDVNAASPIFRDGYLLLSSGYGHGAVLVKLSATNGGKLKHDVVWQGKNLRNKFQSAVYQDGYVYTSDEKEFKCVEFLTGEIQWRKRRVKHGTLVLADGHLFLLDQHGALLIVEATPKELRVKTEAELLSGRCWTVPMIYDGKLYVRNLSRMACFDITP